MGAVREFLYLSAETMEGLGVTTAEAVEIIERLVRGRARSEAWAAPKAAFLTPDGRYMMATLAAADDPPLLAVKSLVLNPRNPERGLRQINAVVTLLDSDTGLPAAVLDGNWITAVRTAALSAVAAKRLARLDSSVLGFIGCGVQAHSHLRALADLFPVREVRAFGRGAANRDAFCRTAEEMGFTAIASPSGQAAIEGADIVVTSVTVSTTLEPFLDARGLEPGAFAAVTDFALPWVKEGMRAFDRLIVDDLEQEATAERPMVERELIRGDFQGLVTGDVPGRQDPRERTAFVFRGLAIGDLALAALAYRKAREAGRGSRIA